VSLRTAPPPPGVVEIFFGDDPDPGHA